MAELISSNKRATIIEGININQGRDFSDVGAGYVTNAKGFTDDMDQFKVSISGSTLNVSNGCCFVRYQKYLQEHFLRCELTQDYTGSLVTGYVWVELDTSVIAVNSSQVDGKDIFKINYGASLPASGYYYPIAQIVGATVTDLRVKRDIDVGAITGTGLNITGDIINNGINLSNLTTQDFNMKSSNYTALLTDNAIGYNGTGGHTFTLPTAVGNTGKEFRLKNLTTLQLNITSVSNIDNAPSLILGSYNGVIVRSNGSVWAIVSNINNQGITNGNTYSNNFSGTLPGVGNTNTFAVSAGFQAKTVNGVIRLTVNTSYSDVVFDINYYYNVSTNTFRVYHESYTNTGSYPSSANPNITNFGTGAAAGLEFIITGFSGGAAQYQNLYVTFSGFTATGFNVNLVNAPYPGYPGLFSYPATFSIISEIH